MNHSESADVTSRAYVDFADFEEFLQLRPNLKHNKLTISYMSLHELVRTVNERLNWM